MYLSRIETGQAEPQDSSRETRNGAVSALEISWRYAERFFGAARARELAAQLPGDGADRGPIAHATFWRMCIDNVVCNGDEAHGIACRPLPRSSWGMVYAAVNQVDTLGDGLKRFAQLVSILDIGIGVSLSYSARGVHVRYEMDGDAVDGLRADQYLESLAMFFHCMLLSFTNRIFVPIELRLSERLDPQDGSLLARLSCSRSRKGTGLSVVYDQEAMAFPLGARKYSCWCAAGGETLFRLLAAIDERTGDRADGEGGNLADEVRRLLAARPVSQERAAAMLKLSTATLRRRLANEGTTFREISREVRTRRLAFLLGSGQRLDDIADKLGLSDRRSLSRACNQWLGMSPTDYQSGGAVVAAE